MAWTTLLLKLFEKLFDVLSWPSINVVCPVCVSFWVIESDSFSQNQQCLAFWVFFALFTIVDQALAKVFLWIPFWPYVKGMATVFSVIPNFGGAAYIYENFVRPYLSENSMEWIAFFLARDKCVPSVEQEFDGSAAGAKITECGHEGLEKSIFKQLFEPNHDNTERGITLPANPNQVQTEWSCALCLISTTSEKCLKKHLQGKKHKANEENLRAEKVVLMHDTYNSWLNLVNLELWDGLLTPIRWCRWKRPDLGWVKLNTDGSIDREKSSFGGLLRDYNGDAICGFVSKAPGDDIFLVELWAIWRGLSLALSIGIPIVWVESDALSVVNTINRKQAHSGKAASCLKSIWALLKKFKKSKVTHSWREANRAADYLAKMVVQRNDVVLCPGDFPNELRSIIKDDAQGKIYRRLKRIQHNPGIIVH